MYKNKADLRKFLVFSVAILIIRALSAQIVPYTILFDDTMVNVINITMDPDSLAQMYDELENEYEYAVQFVYTSPLGNDTLENVGFRLRGNTSLTSAKKSFKISFNTYESGREFEGAKRLNLIGNHNDPTMSREKIYFDVYNALGLPARRVSFVKVYINNNFYGLYTLTEEYDEIFLRDRYGDDTGNLYKCVYGSNMSYNGDNQNAYPSYELLNNELTNDKSDLFELTRVLNNTPIADLPCELEKVFNVDQFLKIFALDVSMGHWDNYGINQNNYYLYHNQFTGQIEFLSYDCDNVMGVDWFGIDWTTRNIYEWNFDDRPLVQRLMQVPEYQDRFSYYINVIATGAMNPATINPHVDSIRELIAPAALEDLYRTYDWGYSYADFYDGFSTNGIDSHTPFGIKPFITSRSAATIAQVELNNIAPIINAVNHSPGLPQPGEDVNFTAYIHDDVATATVLFNYSNDNIAYTQLAMFDDGLHGDGIAGDHIYGINIETYTDDTQLYYFITAEDNFGLINVYPICETARLKIGYATPSLVINEFMAINNITYADEFGLFPDYIEIYNSGATPIYLGDKFLSDEFDRPSKWRFPDFNLGADSYLIIFADGKETAGDFHCSFKLDGDKDEILISAGPEYYYPIIDSISFVAQQPDISVGRIPNGSGPFVVLDEPSPNQNNELFVPIDTVYTQSLTILGNPATDATTLILGLESLSAVTLDLVDINGQKVANLLDGIMGEGQYVNTLDIAHLASGVYFFRLVADKSISTYKFVVL